MRYKLHITRLFIILPLFVSIFPTLKAQETLIFVANSPSEDYNENSSRSKSKEAIPLELPFFDDFSDSYFNPNPEKWADNYVFVNGSYPINPPSLGVATFDAVDNRGEFYNNAGYGNSFDADTLTSNPINLNYPLDNSIFLSFYYEPGGKGDFPDEQDTLSLDFYAPETDTWSNIWKIKGFNTAIFKQVIIPVQDEKYLKDGFQFRFRNKVSLSGSNDPSKAVNVDHWHIDYVKLDKGRSATDTVYKEIAFVYPMASILKTYESMPWKHFISSPTAQLSTNVGAYYRSNDDVVRLIDSIYFVFHDNSGNEPNDTVTGGSYNVEPKSQVLFNPPFTYTFLTNAIDSASFNIKGRLVTDSEDPIVNNEVVYVQKFYDYYSYDDNSAEAGYGLTGEGAQNAQLACKFNVVKEDTLKAIQMYFNRSVKAGSQQYFKLTIWDDNDGSPGQIIYQRVGIRPEYEDQLNKFHTYYISDTSLVIHGVFYVGWVQTTSDLLNLGFDFNSDHKQNNFYNINGEWKNSIYSGSLMIRTFFGKMLTTEVSPVHLKEKADVKIFPNPTNDQIQIQIDNQSNYQHIQISIYSISGTIVHQSNYNLNQTIDLTNLTQGIYLIKLTDKTKKLNYSQKIIKLN